MKAKELRDKTDKELRALLEENRADLGKLKLDSDFKKIKNVNEIKNLRRNIAKILTILNEKSK